MKFDAAATQYNSPNPPTIPWEGDDFIEVLISTSSGTTNWIPLFTYNGSNAPSNIGETRTINLSAYANQNVRFAFRMVEGADNGDADIEFFVDNFLVRQIPSCIEPTVLTATSPSTNSVNLSWTENGTATVWEVQYGAPGFTLGTGTIVSNITSNSSYVLSGLLPNTNYQVYVRSVCNTTSLSPWSSLASFKTLCVDVTSFFEDLEAYPSGTTIIPDCWARGGNSVNGVYVTTGSLAPMSPTKRLYMFANGTANPPTETYAILPPVSNLQAGTHRLRFSAHATATDRILEIGYLTDPSNVATFVQLEEISLPGTAVANTQQFVIIPSGIPAGIKYLAIKNPGFPGSTTTAYLDDIAWEAIPACSNPTNVFATLVTSSGATINWTGNTTDVTWEIEYGAPGFTLGSGTVVPAATNPFTLTGLAPNTAFQYYVRAVCAGPITSGNSFAGTFTTLCSPFVPNYTENFTTFLPSCWKRAGDGSPATGPTGTLPGFWEADGFLNSGTTGAVKVNIYDSGLTSWLISPLINMSVGGYRVRYDVAATIWNGTTATTMGSDDTVQFLMSTDGGATWTALEVYNTTNTPTNASVTKTYNIPAVNSATTLFAFYASGGTVEDLSDYDFFIDNFIIDTPPLVAPVCATNIVATPNACGNVATNISWTAVSNASGYVVNVSTTPGGANIATNNTVNSTTYAFVGNPNTVYYYTVVPFNVIGSATGCVEQTFTTGVPCACTPVYEFGTTDGDLISNVVITGTTLSNNTGAVAGGPSYTYYTGQPNYTATLQAGSTYAITVTVGTFGNQNVAAWIDYNDNLTFEPSERVGFTTTSIGANGTASFSITLLCNPPLGLHRMRIRDVWNTPGSQIDPCANYGYGETEDYNVTISAAVACPQPSNLAAANITSTSASLSWNIGCAETLWDVHVTTAGSGAPTGAPSNPNVSSPFSAASLTPSTAYEFYVRADCAANGTSLWTGPFAFTTLALPPTNDECANALALTPGGVFATNQITGTNQGATGSNQTAPSCASYAGGDVWYSAVVPASGSLTFEVNTATNGITDAAGSVYSGTCSNLVEIACNDSSSTAGDDHPRITVTNQTPGSVLYFRVWEYGNNAFGTFLVSVYDASLSSSSFDNASFKAYPNPVNDVLNLSYSSEITAVKVVNLLGQEVVSNKVNSTSTQVDLSRLSAGAYLVNVTVGDVVKTIKVIKQ